jgi:hypothetical protein
VTICVPVDVYGSDVKNVDPTWPEREEVAVDACDLTDLQSFGHHYNRGVGPPSGKSWNRCELDDPVGIRAARFLLMESAVRSSSTNWISAGGNALGCLPVILSGRRRGVLASDVTRRTWN